MNFNELYPKKKEYYYLLKNIKTTAECNVSNCVIDKQKAKLLMRYINKKENEIERLNNIINEAKIYCEDVIQEHENGEYDVDTVWLAIKEHKGNIKSVLNILNGDLKNYWRGDKE